MGLTVEGTEVPHDERAVQVGNLRHAGTFCGDVRSGRRSPDAQGVALSDPGLVACSLHIQLHDWLAGWGAFAVLVSAVVDHRQATEILAAEGLITSAGTGALKAHPTTALNRDVPFGS